MPGDFGGDFSGGGPTSFVDLKTNIASYLGRTDLTAFLPFFITFFEAAVNRRLRVRQQETVVSLTTTAGFVALPTDYLSWRRLTWSGSNTSTDLKYKTPSALRALFPTFQQGIPTCFSIENAGIQTADTDDTASAFVFEYFAKVPSLTIGENWLYTAHPDLYMFGSLAEAYGFQKDSENMALWGSRRNDVFDEIERLDTKTRAPSAITVISATP